jgi:hypothetical protein
MKASSSTGLNRICASYGLYRDNAGRLGIPGRQYNAGAFAFHVTNGLALIGWTPIGVTGFDRLC